MKKEKPNIHVIQATQRVLLFAIDAKISALKSFLTPEQLAKYDALVAESRKQFKAADLTALAPRELLDSLADIYIL